MIISMYFLHRLHYHHCPRRSRRRRNDVNRGANGELAPHPSHSTPACCPCVHESQVLTLSPQDSSTKNTQGAALHLREQNHWAKWPSPGLDRNCWILKVSVCPSHGYPKGDRSDEADGATDVTSTEIPGIGDPW